MISAASETKLIAPIMDDLAVLSRLTRDGLEINRINHDHCRGKMSGDLLMTGFPALWTWGE
jgi:vacuolar-type H+-ATPase subunit B/Vma2